MYICFSLLKSFKISSLSFLQFWRNFTMMCCTAFISYVSIQWVLSSWGFFFFLRFFFGHGSFFKIFIEFVTILLLFYVLVFRPQDMWGLSSPTRGQTHTSSPGRQSLNHQTTREISSSLLLQITPLCSKLHLLAHLVLTIIL